MTRRRKSPNADAAPGFAALLRRVRPALPACTREHKFHRVRKWRFDLAWPSVRLAVEVEGGHFLPRGHHGFGAGFESDCEKYNAAAELDWLVLRYPTSELNRDPIGVASQIERVYRMREAALQPEAEPVQREMFTREF